MKLLLLVSSLLCLTAALKLQSFAPNMQEINVSRLDPYQNANLRPNHVRDLMVPDWPSPKDRHPLWRNFNSKNHIAPWFDGAWGSTFLPQYGESPNGFFKIASPVPIEAGYQQRRIVANEAPAPTISSNFNALPRRSDVVQINIPGEARTVTTERHFDPSSPPMLPVQTVPGTIVHGIQY